MNPSRVALLTIAAMFAFAANSLLCRMALGHGLIDAASYTSVRIATGAITLFALTAASWRSRPARADWRGIVSLSTYMIAFSFAYISLDAGTGALLLFGAVQLTMFVVAVRSGERFTRWSWIGLAVAFAGLAVLVAPGIAAPDPSGAILMVVAGIAWGAYSLAGRKAGTPALLATAGNFVYSVPVAIALAALYLNSLDASPAGLALAAASGALASGLGYAIWYSALPGLKSGTAATVQLSVPVIAAVGGVLLLSEPITLRLLLASAMTLGGIWLVLTEQRRPAGAR
jgi:drug/metabolite transporter (DMT)-like permease